MNDQYVDIKTGERIPEDITERLMAGEIFVVREGLQRLGIFDDIAQTSLDNVRAVAGEKSATEIEKQGFEAIHQFTGLDQIEAITDRLYEDLGKKGPSWVAKIAPELLRIKGSYFFERLPNVRYHVPYDVMASDPKTMQKFAKKAGGGKLAPHPNHRDSWVGCPSNLINIWAAVGRITEGNGLALYPEVYKANIARVGGSIAFDENPGPALTFDLAPGDAILFHGDHVHSSVLNRTQETRHAISFRVVTEKPKFENGHYHHYAHSSLAGGALDAIAELPANLAWTYVETRLGWVAERLGLTEKEKQRQNSSHAKRRKRRLGGERTFSLEALPENSVQAVSEDVCVARIGKDKIVAFGRRCPHEGGDLSLGTVRDGHIACPWHDLRFSPEDGRSACQSLKVRLYNVRRKGDQVTIELDRRKDNAEAPGATVAMPLSDAS